ncbi:hypothetical protein CPC08DRAFT_363675 [Agrocybe pediades]|nr:hypothetical protein CPC08DRAFT_363675 [Agrocybe pediades]
MNPLVLIPGVPLECFSLHFSGQNGAFPFPCIHPHLTFPRVERDARGSTSANSTTATPAFIRSFAQVNLELEELHVSHVLFQNLVAYGDPTRMLPGTVLPHNTLGLTPNGRSEAAGEDIFQAVLSMSTETESMQLPARTSVANSQNSTQINIINAVFPITASAIMVCCPVSSPPSITIDSDVFNSNATAPMVHHLHLHCLAGGTISGGPTSTPFLVLSTAQQA